MRTEPTQLIANGVARDLKRFQHTYQTLEALVVFYRVRQPRQDAMKYFASRFACEGGCKNRVEFLVREQQPQRARCEIVSLAGSCRGQDHLWRKPILVRLPLSEMFFQQKFLRRAIRVRSTICNPRNMRTIDAKFVLRLEAFKA